MARKVDKRIVRTRRNTSATVTDTRHEVVLANGTRLSVSSFPIDDRSGFVPLSETISVRPGGTATWYTNGPQGLHVTISLSRIINSAGHNHPGGPTGSISPASFTLSGPYPQNIRSVFSAPDASGAIEQVLRASNGQSNTNYNRVEIPGLVALVGGVGMVLTGSTSTHPSNHFGTPNLHQKLSALAAAFHAKFNKNIFVNDMSLPQGGLFDHKATWAPPHATHREGVTADINSTSMSDVEKDFFRGKAAELGFIATLETAPPHWHLKI